MKILLTLAILASVAALLSTAQELIGLKLPQPTFFFPMILAFGGVWLIMVIREKRRNDKVDRENLRKGLTG